MLDRRITRRLAIACFHAATTLAIVAVGRILRAALG